MKRKRGGGKRKPTRPSGVVASDSFNVGHQNVDNTYLDDFGDTEFDYKMNTETLQADTNMRGQQVDLTKRVVNEGVENNVTSLSKVKKVVSGNLSKRSGKITSNSSMGFGSSKSINPIDYAALPQGERTCQREPRLDQQDPRCNEEDLNTALLVIKIVMKSDAAQPFNVPVNPIALGIPDYFDVIDTPMDFGTVRKNLENGLKYLNSEDVFKDVKLIWENCSKYNKKGAYILELMKRVKTNFMKFWDAAGLDMERPQDINGYSQLQPPMESNSRRSKRVKGSSVVNPAPQLHDQRSPSEVQLHRPSSIYSQRHQPQLCHNQLEHSLHQPDTSSNQPQHEANIEYSQLQHPVESNTRRSNRGKGNSVVYPAPQLQDQMRPSELQLHRPLSIYSQGHQPQPYSNQLEHCPQQPDTSSNQPQLGENIDSSSKQAYRRARGPSRCLELWNSVGKRVTVTNNELGEPVGLEAPKLASFLGTVARDGLMAPLTYPGWRSMPDENKEKMWQQVELKFDIDPICKTWVLKSLGNLWKNWKSKLKASHYNTHATDEERLADRDKRVLPDQWLALVSYWSSEEAEKRSAQNKANRAKQKFTHTTGKKSYARIREEQRAKRPDGKEPSRAELFILTHTHKDGSPVNQASSTVISKLRERATQQQNTLANNQIPQDNLLDQLTGQDSRRRGRSEATRLAYQANAEVCEMKERMGNMEQICAQMVTQMSTMMVIMSTMGKSSDKHQSQSCADTGDFEGVQQQVNTLISCPPVLPRETRASKRTRLQK